MCQKTQESHFFQESQTRAKKKPDKTPKTKKNANRKFNFKCQTTSKKAKFPKFGLEKRHLATLILMRQVAICITNLKRLGARGVVRTMNNSNIQIIKLFSV
jgi:hypothetical protein